MTAEANGHFGLVGMRGRAEAVGGLVVVTSAPGQGTTIEARIPYEPSRAIAEGPRAELVTDAAGEPERHGILARLFGR